MDQVAKEGAQIGRRGSFYEPVFHKILAVEIQYSK